MTKDSRLVLIKTLHTLIWVFFNVVIFYMLYAVFLGELNLLFWLGYAFVFLEGLVLLIYNFTCPLTIQARKYSSSPKDNFDIYLPNWLAKNTKLIYSGLVVVISIAMLLRILR